MAEPIEVPFGGKEADPRGRHLANMIEQLVLASDACCRYFYCRNFIIFQLFLSALLIFINSVCLDICPVAGSGYAGVFLLRVDFLLHRCCDYEST